MKSKIALFTALALVAGSAVAADTGFYVGAGMGYSKMNVNESKLTNTINNAFQESDVNLFVGKESSDQYSTPYSIFVGYKFMPYLAAEVAYLDMGSSNFKARIDYDNIAPTPDDQGVATIKGDWHATGWPVSALGIWPINETWSVFGRVGIFMGDMKVTAKGVLSDNYFDCSPNCTVIKGHDSEGSTEFFGGAGVDANFMDTWAARLEWQAMPSVGNNDTGSGNFNNFMFSIMYKF
jgi:opacity protein-like surface antigen